MALNPCRTVRPAKAEKKESRYLDVDDARRMLGLIAGIELEGPVLLALTGGLREAEVCGVSGSDIDLESGTLFVRRSFWGETKSGKTRSLVLPAFALDRLRLYRARQAESLLRFGVALSDETLITRVYGHYGQRCKAGG